MSLSPHYQFSLIFQATSCKDNKDVIKADLFFSPTKKSNSHFSSVNSAVEFSLAASPEHSVSPKGITVNKGGKTTHNSQISELLHKLSVIHAAPWPTGTSPHQFQLHSFYPHLSTNPEISQVWRSHFQLHQHLQGFTLSKPHLTRLWVILGTEITRKDHGRKMLPAPFPDKWTDMNLHT